MNSDIWLAIILGGLFGFVLYYVGASNPKKLISMLRLEDLTLMKIILFGIGLGSILLSISALIGMFDVSHLNVKSTYLGVLIGGMIFGIGFGWAGTCPGTCVAAVSSGGFRKAIAAIIGGLLGAFCFTVTYEWIVKLEILDMLNYGRLTLFNISDKFPSVLPGGYWGLLIVGAVFVIGALALPDKYLDKN